MTIVEPPTTGLARPVSTIPTELSLLATSWDIPLRVPHPESVDPRHLHSVVSRTLDSSSAAHRAPTKHYAVGPLWERFDGRPGFALRQVGEPAALPPVSEVVRLGDQEATIEWPEAHLVESIAKEELAQAEPVRSVLVRFASPMTRRRGNHYLPNPTEEGILGSWERTAAIAGLDGRVDWRNAGARIAHLQGESVAWTAVKGPWRKHRPVGFVGDVALVVDPAHRRRLHQLAKLAAFAGTGSHTTFGMGFTELVDLEPDGSKQGGRRGE